MDRQARQWWQRLEFPVVLVVVLGLIAAAAAGTARAGSTADDFPVNAATDLWPRDGEAVDIAYTTAAVTEPGTIEHARLRGYEGLTGVPAPMVDVMFEPYGDPENSHWWRQTSVRFNDLDRRIQLRQATSEGTHLYAQSWGWQGMIFGPPILEVPADVHAGATWESRGQAGFQRGGVRDVTDYHNTSRADPPQDAAEAEQGCLVVTSSTDVQSFAMHEESVWCPQRGIVRQEGRWGSLSYSFVPAPPTPVSEQVRQTLPPPDLSDSDPATWSTGPVQAPVEDDPVFGVATPVLVPTTDPVVGPLGQISVANQFNGDVVTVHVDESGTSQYPEGSAVLQWRSRPGGGDVVAVGTHGELVTAVTTNRRLSLIGGNGARRWTIELSEVAAQPPISLTPDRIAVATLDGRVRMLDVATGTEIWNTAASQQAIALPMATDGRTIAAVDEGYRLLLLDAHTGELLSNDLEFGQPVNDVAVVDGTVVLSVGQVIGVDARSGRIRWRTEISVPQHIEVSDRTVAVTTLHDVHLIEADAGRVVARQSAVTALVGARGGFVALADGHLELWNTAGEAQHEWDLGGAPATVLTVGAGRVWAFDRATLTGMWVQP